MCICNVYVTYLHFDHFFTWKRCLLTKIGTIYINQNIFHNFVQLFRRKNDIGLAAIQSTNHFHTLRISKPCVNQVVMHRCEHTVIRKCYACWVGWLRQNFPFDVQQCTLHKSCCRAFSCKRTTLRLLTIIVGLFCHYTSFNLFNWHW